MFAFTKHEKCVLLFVTVVVAVGAASHYALIRYPALQKPLRVIDSKQSYFTVDINTATKEDLVRLPCIGDYTAGQIIRYREAHGKFKDLSELKKVKGIRDKNYEKFHSYLKLR